MIYVLVIWFFLALSSFGVLGLNYVYAYFAAKRPWKIRMDKDYLPSVSIIVPTYNEFETIKYKLRNLKKLSYPKNLVQIVFADSKSTDSTLEEIRAFAEQHPDFDTKIIVEDERKGKTSALNMALRNCTGDVVVVSDADCFWNSTILIDSLPYLADPSVGAVSGPKRLLNPTDSWVTKNEDRYLKSMNLMKLGESKKSSTIFFEGGFSAYKKGALESFDPYKTGSDDCGSLMSVLEKNLKTIMVPEAEFFTTFSKDWSERMAIKIRRSGQLIRVLGIYGEHMLRARLKTERKTLAKNLFLYLLAPVVFLLFLVTTAYFILIFPVAIVMGLVFLVPKINTYVAEVVLNYFIILYSMILTATRKQFVVWKKPADRALLTEEMLVKAGLI